MRAATCGISYSFGAGHSSFSIGSFLAGQPGLLGFSLACDAVFVRTGPGRGASELCEGPFDCEEGLVCDLSSGCQAPSPLGEACPLPTMCYGPDELCVEGRCTRIVRQRTAGVGAPCGVLTLADRVVDERCVEEATCTRPGSIDAPAHCVRLAEEGEPCRDNPENEQPCRGSLLCARPPAGIEGVCVRIEVTTVPGAECVRYPDGAFTTICDPRAGLFCSSVGGPGTCVPAP